MNLTAQRVIRGVYAITPQVQGHWTRQAVLDAVQAALEGGVRLFQCRQKHWEEDALVEFVADLADLCMPYSAHLIVNDASAEALSMWPVQGVDGVHLGKEDEPVDSARQHLPAGMLIGASCYNRLDLAEQAVKKGADYVAFGAVYSSSTKPLAVHAPLSLFEQAAHLQVPRVAIGGITLDRIAELRQAGADAVAVVGGLFGAADVTPRPLNVLNNARHWVHEFEDWSSTP
ncbi:thiamine phosphate synthase [Limnobacter humi]|uniref:Thiamine-phosphate synthase n=1 Tax=Limnobacter humi TaxID=1778671 RepID=A0ABT1WC59_9BURK|nr:thiamine phosphate synthase [Limnobacter humi]MCQ8895099.1 thiamine phosphate synthase [Limnobacter humi]